MLQSASKYLKIIWMYKILKFYKTGILTAVVIEKNEAENFELSNFKSP
jgi:hypothetical protein